LISIYITSYGEYAHQVGAGAALELDDYVSLQYRETGLLFYRGVTVKQFFDQCFGTENDKATKVEKKKFKKKKREKKKK
jgi:2-oxoisovalerate dehydrogenase E1 component alpha subunit